MLIYIIYDLRVSGMYLLKTLFYIISINILHYKYVTSEDVS